MNTFWNFVAISVAMNLNQQKLISNLLILIGTALTIPFGEYLIESVKNHQVINLNENISALALFIFSLVPYFGAFMVLDKRFENAL